MPQKSSLLLSCCFALFWSCTSSQSSPSEEDGTSSPKVASQEQVNAKEKEQGSPSLKVSMAQTPNLNLEITIKQPSGASVALKVPPMRRDLEYWGRLAPIYTMSDTSWFGTPGEYQLTFKTDLGTQSVTQVLTGEERQFEVMLSPSEAEDGAPSSLVLLHTKRSLNPHPGVSLAPYDIKSRAVVFELLNKSPHTIYSADPLGRMMGFIQRQTSTGWVLHQDDVLSCVTTGEEIQRVFKPTQTGLIKEPYYHHVTPFVPGKYRFVVEYTLTPKDQTARSVYTIVAPFTVPEP